MSDIPPEVMDELIAQYLAEQGSAQTGEQANFYGAMPMYNLEGEPYTLTSQLNQMQDVNMLMQDPFFQGMGGAGGFSQQAFQPEVSMEVVDSPEYVRWQNYLNTPDSFEGMIAAELRDGGTPRSALRKIRAKVDESPEGALAQEIAMYFPVRDDMGIRAGEIDWSEAANGATEIDEMRSQIPQIGNQGFQMEDGTLVSGGGEIMEVIGPDGQPQLVRRTETPSELQQQFDEAGMPNPFEQYTPEGIMGPEWQAQDEAFFGGQANVDALSQASEEAYRRYMAESDVTPRGTANRGAGSTTNDAGYDVLSSAQENVRQQPGPTAAELDMIEATRERALSNGPPTPSILDPQVIPPLAEQLIAEGHELPPDWTYTINPDGTIGPPLPEEYQAGGTHGYEEPRTEAARAEEPEKSLTLENAATDDGVGDRWFDEVYPTLTPDEQQAALYYFDEVDVARETGSPLPPAPEIGPPAQAQGFAGTPRLGGEVPAGSTSKIAPRDYQGRVPGQAFYPQGGEEPVPPIEGGGALDEYLDNYTPIPGPDYATSGSNYLQQQAEAQREAMLRLILPGNGQQTMNQPRPQPSGTNIDELLAPGGSLGGQNPWDRLTPSPGPPRQPAYDPLSSAYLPPQEAGTYRNTWGPTDNPFTAFGLNQEYIPPGESGGPTPDYATSGSNYLQEQAEAEARRPDYATSGSNYRQQQAEAMLRQILPGNQQRTMNQPSSEPMTAAMIAQIIGGTRQRTGERPEEERYDPLSSAGTGERVRTGEERREQAERNAPQGLQGEEYDVLGSPRTRKGMKKAAWMDAYRQRSNALVDRQAQREQMYGADFGRAVAAAMRAQQAGATPMQQVYAQRMQNIQRAGIPLGAQPQLLQY